MEPWILMNSWICSFQHLTTISEVTNSTQTPEWAQLVFQLPFQPWQLVSLRESALSSQEEENADSLLQVFQLMILIEHSVKFPEADKILLCLISFGSLTLTVSNQRLKILKLSSEDVIMMPTDWSHWRSLLRLLDSLLIHWELKRVLPMNLFVLKEIWKSKNTEKNRNLNVSNMKLNLIKKNLKENHA